MLKQYNQYIEIMDLIKFFELTGKLKDVERSGWTERGVQRPETSSDHSLMVAFMVIVLGRGRKLNMKKMLKMAIIHDLPEAIMGDIITKENWEKGGQTWNSEKVSKERPAIQKLSSLAGNQEILHLWEEFEACQTPEAKFVKDIDKLATIFQAIEYHKNGNYKKSLPGF